MVPAASNSAVKSKQEKIDAAHESLMEPLEGESDLFQVPDSKVEELIQFLTRASREM